MSINPISGHSATLLNTGQVLSAGGLGQYANRAAQLYDPASGTFALTGRMVIPRIGHAAVALPDGRVLIAGGSGPWDSAARDVVPLLDSAEIYDPQTEAFTATGNMISAGHCVKGVLLGNGKVLIVGGSKNLSDPPSAAPAQLYDPIAGKFTASSGNHITTNRSGIYYGACPTAAILLLGGKVLIPWSDAEAEIYDPDADTFTLAGTQHWEEAFSTTVTLLMNGSVLFAGGNGPFDDDTQFGSPSAEIYVPSSSTFAPTMDMITARYDQTATLLPDGTVLLAGTNRSGVGVTTGLAAAELYDPATGAFSPTSPMTTPRYGHTATLLPDGSVLMAGGVGVPNDATAERYYPNVLVPSPALLTATGDSRQGAILHSGTARIAGSTNPAVPGEVLEIYCKGLKDGKLIPSQVAIGGRMAEVLWFGTAPGFANLNQVNVRVTEGVAQGPAVPVRLRYIDRPSNEVTIGVR